VENEGFLILSFHPCYEADVNRLCAGREPDADDRAAIRLADAVILPQGCREPLYRMARENCPHVFPNYDKRFDYPGKTGQSRLFEDMAVPHPRTWAFDDTTRYEEGGTTIVDHGFPLVFKLDWGGEGDTVFLLHSESDLTRALSTAAAYERSGQKGFVIQHYIGHAGRTLRVVVVGQTMVAYWRVQNEAVAFGSSVAKGATIDTESTPHLRRHAIEQVRRFCRQSRIDLAGIDLLFDASVATKQNPQAYFLEINYFFGRTGLGGSERFYDLLAVEIDRWLDHSGIRSAPAPGETA
jgi:ribosomal protein S6--L-glutamate ligase